MKDLEPAASAELCHHVTAYVCVLGERAVQRELVGNFDRFAVAGLAF